ncbi:mycothiol synthase [Georgenia faecalis]|uniref:Mycothiol acetyltransferase n=1 Tax=Georgenia faecalis TaxID=2483799 RepID=A0ABV9DC79_9MICO|nr:mycothiol synthase [Georgenia faecalis]
MATDAYAVTEGPLTGATPAAVLALLAEATRRDGVAPVSEQGLLALRHRSPGVRHLWVAHGPEVLGYAQVDDGGSAELVVHPDHRRRGVGRRLLEALRPTANGGPAVGTEDAADAAGDSAGPAVWAHGDLPGARALARAAGLEVTRELWFMALDLPAPDAPLDPGPGERAERAAPDGVGLRTFVPGEDEAAWVALNARAFADHPEQGRLTVDDVRAREEEPWFDPAMLWLAHESGDPARLLASMWVKVVPGEDEGEIYAVGVDPAAQGRGLGRWLTAVALDAMTHRGLRRATLYVEGDNAVARRTYERAGFRRAGVDVQYRWGHGARDATMGP